MYTLLDMSVEVVNILSDKLLTFENGLLCPSLLCDPSFWEHKQFLAAEYIFV